MTIKNEEDAFAAMKVLHDKGVKVVILSSSEICTQPGQFYEVFFGVVIVLFVTKALVQSSQNPWYPLPLRLWRHLWTNP